MTLLDLDQVVIDPTWAFRIPASLALRREILPLARIAGVVHVACGNPDDQGALQAVQRHLRCEIKPEAVDPAALRRVLARLFREGRPAEQGEAVSLSDEVLHLAAFRRASDIHLDPDKDGLRVRIRVDGGLEEIRRVPPSLQAELIGRFKVMGGLDIAEKRAPQDGRFRFQGPSWGADSARDATIDVRVASLPTKHGERMALRLLPVEAASRELSSLGLGAEALGVLQSSLRLSHGLVLVSGPTGSGKSTTLYAALRQIIAERAPNVLTVEDPIEYDLDGAAQVEIDAADKVNFDRALRAILRHDPDVIMIGEIRDRDSAEVAIRAALTGHLVLSSLHTNSAAGVVTRLLDMGIESYLVAATLRLALAQRLLRRLCLHCRRPIERRGLRPRSDAAEGGTSQDNSARGDSRGIDEAERIWGDVSGYAAGAGCLNCGGRAYRGRIGVFELLPSHETLAQAIAEKARESALAALSGMPTLAEDARAKAEAGLCSLEDALMVGDSRRYGSAQNSRSSAG